MIYNFLHRSLWFDTMEAHLCYHFWKVLGLVIMTSVVLTYNVC